MLAARHSRIRIDHLTLGRVAVAGRVRRVKAGGRDDCAWIHIPAGCLYGVERQRLRWPLHRFDAITASVCNGNPTSPGSIAISSPSARVAPQIQPGDLSTGEDRQVAVESLRLVRRIAAIRALAGCRPHELKPGPVFQADDQLTRLAGDVSARTSPGRHQRNEPR